MNEQLTMKTAVATTGTAIITAADHVSPRTIVVVLGMHRSGTSLCAHVLSCLGIDMADELLVHSSNGKGHWERLELMELHDRMLAICNRGYFTPLHDLALPEAWWADPKVQAIKREILVFLQRRMGVMPFGFKDPRTARLMPLWNQIFRELNLAPKFVLCLRNPAQVARSLRDRDHLDPQTGEYRWFIYLTDIFQSLGKQEFCLVEYEDWFTEPGRNLGKLQQFLEIEWPGSEPDLQLAVSEIVDSELRHDDPRRVQAREPTIRAFYELVRAFSSDSAARQRTRYLTTQFAAYRSLQRPLERAFESAQALANRVVPLEQEIAELQTYLGERNVDIARLGAAATAAQAELDGRNAELATSRQSADEQLAAAEGVRMALADAQQTAREAVEVADRAGADLTQMQADLAVRDATLADAERTAREAKEAADRATSELTRTQADLAVRDAALAEAGQMAVEWAAAMEFAQADLARVQAELAARDATLADAERTAREAKEAADRAQVDLAQVQAELAARDVVLTAAERKAHEAREMTGRAMAELGQAQAELAAHEAILAAAEQQAAEQAAAAEAAQADLARVQKELAVRDATLAEAEQMAAEWAAAMEFAQADLGRVAAERAAAVERAQAEVVTLRDALVQAGWARQAQAVAADALRTEVVALWDTLAQAENEAQQLDAVPASMQVEIAALRERLAQAEREAQQRETVAATAQGEVAALHERLAQAEREAQQRAAAAATKQGEVAALCERLAQAEREAQQRAAAAATLEAEIVALQGSLTAARQIGRTAIATLEIGMTTPSIPDEPRDWRHAVMRFFGAPGRISNRARRGPAV
jgi:hypothetical protein